MVKPGGGRLSVCTACGIIHRVYTHTYVHVCYLRDATAPSRTFCCQRANRPTHLKCETHEDAPHTISLNYSTSFYFPSALHTVFIFDWISWPLLVCYCCSFLWPSLSLYTNYFLTAVDVHSLTVYISRHILMSYIYKRSLFSCC